ncbi:MAG: DUF309 domain-containing protein [Candidatus Bathyarchaeia archaeon]|jgi:hypothetical protein
MRFLVRLKNTQGFTPKDSRALTKTAYDLIKILNADVGNLRVSHEAIEFDLLVSSKKVMDLCLKKLIEGLGEPLTLRELDLPAQISTPERAVATGIALFNEERYWESHESLEAAWRTATGAEREILQGIILLAASLVHLQKDESEVALSIMKRANVKLPQEGTCHSINLSKLKQRVNGLLSETHPAFFKLPVKESGV